MSGRGRGMERGGYQAFGGGQYEVEHDYGPLHEHDGMVHVVPETNRWRWNHIDDLDSFFTRVYNYHQKHGFSCIVLAEIFLHVQYLFVLGFVVFLVQCVDYPILFKNKPVNATDPTAKVTLSDVLIPFDQCVAGFDGLTWTILVIAFVFWIIRLMFSIYTIYCHWEIRAFYRDALGIKDSELDNMTWFDVQKRIREVQRELQMCIHKQELTELDIYHRINRFRNYMVSMVNKNLLPVRFNVPILGETVFLTHGLKFNFHVILFSTWGSNSPFENTWHLREDYKKVSKRKEMAEGLARRITLVAFINLILAPLIFLWQILYSFFNYAELLKREPGALGLRRWSLFGRIYLRHFNELDHELNARLSRAYRPAAKYMSIFNSPVMSIIAQNVLFIAGAPLAVLTLLTVYDEDVLGVEHVLLMFSILGVTAAVCRALVPDEQMVFCPERLLTGVLAHVHYFPDQWKGQAHTSRTRNEFSHLFQYKAVYLLEELLSPFLTPIILYFHFRPKALEIVDFYRNFTVEVVGVGDVCSFALMDVRKHGNPAWQASTYDLDGSMNQQIPSNNNAYAQAENGKTELSLVHFTHTNPEWLPPNGSEAYITTLKARAARDASNLPTVLEENPFYASLNSLSSFGNEYSAIVTNIILENNLLGNSLPQPPPFEDLDFHGAAELPATIQAETPASSQQTSIRGNLTKQEGPMQISVNRGIVSGTQQSGMFQGPSSNNSTISFARSFAQFPLCRQNTDLNSTLELNAVDMSLDALYLHELHHMELRRRQQAQGAFPTRTIISLTGSESAPLGRAVQGQSQAVISQFQFQPQVHSFPPHPQPLPLQQPATQVSSTSSSSGDSVLGRQGEKTSLLTTKYSNYNNDPLL